MVVSESDKGPIRRADFPGTFQCRVLIIDYGPLKTVYRLASASGNRPIKLKNLLILEKSFFEFFLRNVLNVELTINCLDRSGCGTLP